MRPGFVSQLISNSLDNIDDAHKYGIKSVQIDKSLQQEVNRLFSIIKDRKDILLGTKNLFPEIEILDEYEMTKEVEQEYEEDFEEESKTSNAANTSRTDKQNKKSIVSRKYFLRFTHLGYDDHDDVKS